MKEYPKMVKVEGKGQVKVYSRDEEDKLIGKKTPKAKPQSRKTKTQESLV